MLHRIAPRTWIAALIAVIALGAGMTLAAPGAGATTTRTPTWSAPTRPFGSRPATLVGVSCTDGGFCLAVDSRGKVAELHHGRWKAGPAIGVHVVEVSCGSPTFCAALSMPNGTDGTVWIFRGSSWRRYAKPFYNSDAGAGIVSCTSSRYCLAMDDDGDTWSFHRGTWERKPDARADLADGVLDGLSCTARLTCTMVTSLITDESDSTSETFDGTTWGPVRSISRTSVNDVSCSSPTFCVVSGFHGVYTSTGSRWSSPRDIGFPPTGVSCSSSTQCVAIGRASAVVSIWDGTSWSAPKRIHSHSARLTGISCAPNGFCAAVTRHAVYTRA